MANPFLVFSFRLSVCLSPKKDAVLLNDSETLRQFGFYYYFIVWQSDGISGARQNKILSQYAGSVRNSVLAYKVDVSGYLG
jgi:hypothetical protein